MHVLAVQIEEVLKLKPVKRACSERVFFFFQTTVIVVLRETRSCVTERCTGLWEEWWRSREPGPGLQQSLYGASLDVAVR